MVPPSPPPPSNVRTFLRRFSTQNYNKFPVADKLEEQNKIICIANSAAWATAMMLKSLAVLSAENYIRHKIFQTDQQVVYYSSFIAILLQLTCYYR